MRHPAYWNHNVAYYDWIKNTTIAFKDILDVGCGDGSLVRYLDDGKRKLVGIDVDEECIRRTLDESTSNNVQFICNRFETYNFEKKFDAVIFIASIHHNGHDSGAEQSKIHIETWWYDIDCRACKTF